MSYPELHVSTFDNTNDKKIIYQELLNLDIDVYPGYYNFIHYYPPLNELPLIKDKNLLTGVNSHKNISLYIHIPFCSSACRFCYYSKIINPDKDLIKTYLHLLEKEIILYRKKINVDQIETIYIGGGSPSFLSINEISTLFNIIKTHFDTSRVREITFEGEPNTLSKPKIDLLIENGVTRISVGVQSFNDSTLRKYNRAHNKEEALEIIGILQNSQVKTYNIDYIYGMEGQSYNDLHEILKINNNFSVPSVTFYQLWYASPQKKQGLNWEEKVSPINKIYRMKKILDKSMERQGYQVNNLSWYVKRNKDKCKHYNYTWKNNFYIGLGSSAYSFFGNAVYSNYNNQKKYEECLINNELPIQKGKILSNSENAKRYFILRLKTDLGIDIDEIEKYFNVTLSKNIQKYFDKLNRLDLISLDNKKIKFKNNGLIWADTILSSIINKGLFHE